MNHKTFYFSEMLIYCGYFYLVCSDYIFSIFCKIIYHSEGLQFYLIIDRFHNLSISKDLRSFYTWEGVCFYCLNAVTSAIAKPSYPIDQNKDKGYLFKTYLDDALAGVTQ